MSDNLGDLGNQMLFGGKYGDAVVAVAQLAHTCAIYRDSLINNGFTREEAVLLCGEFVNTVFNRKEAN